MGDILVLAILETVSHSGYGHGDGGSSLKEL